MLSSSRDIRPSPPGFQRRSRTGLLSPSVLDLNWRKHCVLRIPTMTEVVTQIMGSVKVRSRSKNASMRISSSPKGCVTIRDRPVGRQTIQEFLTVLPGSENLSEDDAFRVTRKTPSKRQATISGCQKKQPLAMRDDRLASSSTQHDETGKGRCLIKIDHHPPFDCG